MQRIAQIIANELSLREGQVSTAISLFDDGNTMPFVARYRKEATGNLDEEQLRQVSTRLQYLRNLDARKETVLSTIEEQGNLTDDLRDRIASAMVLQEVEDLYLPYKPKRRTRATVARERGLEPLAKMMRSGEVAEGTPELYAAAYTSDEVPNVEDALSGARDILAEAISEDADTRAFVRRRMLDDAVLVSRRADDDQDAEGKYRVYYEYAEPLKSVPPHRLLALRRGESEGALSVSVNMDEEPVLASLTRRHAEKRMSVFFGQVVEALRDGYHRLLSPSIEREVRSTGLAAAEEHAIRVFSANLRGLLLQAPLKGRRVLALDPGYRTGCKVALVDETGKYLASTAIYPHEPRKRWDESKAKLGTLIRRHDIDVVAIGNGTASRETEALVAEMISEGAAVSYVMVSEAGASVYSASELARDELPDLDVSIRGAVSIGRRLLDPLSELVKIEPRSIGVGLYQHDVDQKALGEALDAVVESAVNYVGVDVNTASPALLRYVAGINARIARAIVAHRDRTGPFRQRKELLDVKGLGAKAYQQSAGFIKIPGGDDPLDNTFIHPESYQSAHRLLDMMGLRGDEPDLAARVRDAWRSLGQQGETLDSVARAIGTGVPTLQDMLENLRKPGRDPREDTPAPILRTDVLKMEDLEEGMVLKGTVRNVVDFGAFVDIGVKQDGLVHISQLADHFVRDPLDVVNVGDIVEVRVLSVEPDRGRIGLSMRSA